jgi:hypothetical protein
MQHRSCLIASRLPRRPHPALSWSERVRIDHRFTGLKNTSFYATQIVSHRVKTAKTTSPCPLPNGEGKCRPQIHRINGLPWFKKHFLLCNTDRVSPRQDCVYAHQAAVGTTAFSTFPVTTLRLHLCRKSRGWYDCIVAFPTNQAPRFIPFWPQIHRIKWLPG